MPIAPGPAEAGPMMVVVIKGRASKAGTPAKGDRTLAELVLSLEERFPNVVKPAPPLTVEEAAKYAGVSPQTIRRWVREEGLPKLQPAGTRGAIRIDADETLVWLLAIEGFLITLVPAIGRWMPGGATAGLLQEGRAATTHGTLLPPWAAGLVLLGYATGIGLLASAVALRRDLT